LIRESGAVVQPKSEHPGHALVKILGAILESIHIVADNEV